MSRNRWPASVGISIRFASEYADYTDEEALLEDATDDKGKVTKGVVKPPLGEFKAVIPAKAGIQNDEDELDALARCLALIGAESEVGQAVKDAQAALDGKMLDAAKNTGVLKPYIGNQAESN